MSSFDPSQGPFDPHVVQQGTQALTASRHFIDASFTMLIYDHMLTFSDEVERIWKPKCTGATLLFLLNRYFTPLQFIVNIASFFDTDWSMNKTACIGFVHFPGASTMCSIAIIEIVLITRTYALYGATSRTLLIFLVSLFAAQMTVMGVALSMSQALNLPPGVSGCILTGSNGFFAAFWIAPLVTDSIIFILTLWKTHQYFRQNVKTPLLQILRRDGILYFAVIFTVNLLNVFLYSLAEEEIKAIGASFSQLATTVMISRLQLNLRNPSVRLPTVREVVADYSSDPSTPNTPHSPQEVRSNGLHVTFGSGKIGEGSSNFFVETLLSLGQPLEEGYSSSNWDFNEADAPFEKPAERFSGLEGGEELQLRPMRNSSLVRTNHDRQHDSEGPVGVIDPETLFPPPRSAELFDDFAGGISISPALIDGPNGPMLYEEWKRQMKRPQT